MEQVRLLCVGLDAAGKTTTLYKLKLGEIVTSIPTIGFNVETVDYSKGNTSVRLTAWDVGGRCSMRGLWRHYYQNTQAVIFVVDSNDRDRIDDARHELDRLLGEDELSEACLLVFANKQDLPNAMNVAEVTDKLRLHSIRRREWFISGSCATSGDGLYEGLDWLVDTLDGKCSRHRPRPSRLDAPKSNTGFPVHHRTAVEAVPDDTPKTDMDGTLPVTTTASSKITR